MEPSRIYRAATAKNVITASKIFCLTSMIGAVSAFAPLKLHPEGAMTTDRMPISISESVPPRSLTQTIQKNRARISAGRQSRVSRVIAAHQGLVQSLNGFEEEAGNMNGRKTFLIFGSSQKSMGRKIAKMIRKNINAFSERQKIALARKLGEITKESREPGVSDQNPEVEKERRKTLWEQLKNLKALVKSFIEQQGITSTKGVVYLTIDDSPSKDFREKVEFLLARGIPAIIFCIGSQLEMEARSEDVVYAIKNGFIIGNHSYGHPRFSKLSVEEARDQVLKTDKLIDGLYRKAGVKRQMKVFRFPYCDRGDGKCNSRGVSEDEKRHIAAIQQVLRANGYKHPRFNGVRYNGHIWPALFVDLHWTYDVRNDGHRPPPLKKTNNIVLIHDNYKAAEEFARELDRLVEAGLRFELPR